MKKRLCFGYVEPVQLLDGQQRPLATVMAKVDTGAFSGVIHAENIKEQDDKLSFELLGCYPMVVDQTKFHRRIVRNTHGQAKWRYLVKMQIIIAGQQFETLLGLDNRQSMKFDMLIGRAFLNKYQILVDTQKNIDLDQEWNKMGEKQ